jgi:NAD+ diphosphatase
MPKRHAAAAHLSQLEPINLNPTNAFSASPDQRDSLSHVALQRDSSSSARSAWNTFSAIPLDRATERRDDAQWLNEIQQHAFEVLISAEHLVAGNTTGESLHLLSCAATPNAQAERWYLGCFENAHYFARAVDQTQYAQLSWLDLRTVALKLSRLEAGLAAYARGLAFWHQRHQFCGICGHETVSQHAGHRRKCVHSNCGGDHFPRTDPAIIVAVEYKEKILLGRQQSWPISRYSTLAGFVEPGESLEDALVREVFEEAGVRVTSCDYFSSQPWPFPASLMLGFTATAADEVINVGAELEHARYFSISELEAALLDSSLRLPPPVSISYRLIEHWYEKRSQRSFTALLSAR